MKPSLLKENRIIKIRILIFLTIVFKTGLVLGEGERDLSFSKIPAKLLENAGTVVRYHDRIFQIKSASSAVLNEKIALTVVNESGLESAILTVFYNKFSSVRSVKGKVFNSSGQEVERLRKEDFADLSAIQGFSTYEDNRLVIGKPKYMTFPFTVEFSFEIAFKGLLDIPDFNVLDDFNVSAEESTLTVIVPASSGIRFFGQNTQEEASISRDKETIQYQWKFGHYPAIIREPVSPPEGQLLPRILLTPLTFSVAGYEGNTSSWESLGKWHYDLISDKAELTDESKKKILDLTSGAANNREKVTILYKYLQEHTHYASIQIGIGSWQPENAKEVDRLGYGDCKALTNYMRAMLDVVDIEGLYSLVYAGTDAPDVVVDFPSNQFNHVILCVPFDKDSMWLECTSQHNPAGYLGTFTDDRLALIITENGGFLRKTPQYDIKLNAQETVSHVSFTENNGALVNFTRRNRGMFFDDMVSYLFMDSKEQQLRINQGINLKNFTLDKFTITESRQGLPEIIWNVELTLDQALVPVGNALLFNPGMFLRENKPITSVFHRKTPLYVPRSVTVSDTIDIVIPEGYRVEGAPFESTLSSSFGKYHSECMIAENRVRYIRSVVTYKGEWNAEEYDQFIEYQEKVSDADSRKLRLFRNTGPQN
jgi:hypothetical protein